MCTCVLGGAEGTVHAPGVAVQAAALRVGGPPGGGGACGAQGPRASHG